MAPAPHPIHETASESACEVDLPVKEDFTGSDRPSSAAGALSRMSRRCYRTRCKCGSTPVSYIMMWTGYGSRAERHQHLTHGVAKDYAGRAVRQAPLRHPRQVAGRRAAPSERHGRNPDTANNGSRTPTSRHPCAIVAAIVLRTERKTAVTPRIPSRRGSKRVPSRRSGRWEPTRPCGPTLARRSGHSPNVSRTIPAVSHQISCHPRTRPRAPRS